MDPHRDNYYRWSPYIHVGNNSMKYFDSLEIDITRFEFNRGKVQAVNSRGEDAMLTILPEVRVTGQSPWSIVYTGRVYRLVNSARGTSQILGEKPLEQVNIEFDIFLTARFTLNLASSGAQVSTTTSAVAENLAAKVGRRLLFLEKEWRGC